MGQLSRMDFINRGTVRPARRATRHWAALLAAALVLTGCGGRLDDTSKGSGAKGAAGANGGGGGASGSGGGAGVPGDLLHIDLDAGVVNCVCEEVFDDPCDKWTLWGYVRDGIYPGLDSRCLPSSNDPSRPVLGAIVLDGEGQVIDNTGMDATRKEWWLDSLSSHFRWPCLAGQTIQYYCT